MNETTIAFAAHAAWCIVCFAFAFYAWHIGYEFGRIDERRTRKHCTRGAPASRRWQVSWLLPRHDARARRVRCFPRPAIAHARAN